MQILSFNAIEWNVESYISNVYMQSIYFNVRNVYSMYNIYRVECKKWISRKVIKVDIGEK